MSQKVSRKSAVSEEKETRNSPVKEMKKKMAANAEKEKQAAEKATEKTDKPTEKTDKPAEKVTEKAAEKTEKSDKPDKGGDKKSDKSDKGADKKPEKQTKEEQKKPEPQPEKTKAEGSKEDKSGKPEKQDTKEKKPEQTKSKQNGRDRAHNGVSDVTLATNGTVTEEVLNGTVSADSEDDDVMLVIDDNDQDDLFPELTYEDTSDGDCFELPTPENGPSRSLTRRSQVKSTRTPETPRPASDKQPDREADDPKDKVLKLKEDATTTTDRKLRSSDSPKPQEGKKENKKDSPKKSGEGLEKVEEKDEDAAKSEEKKEGGELDVEVAASEESSRKRDTNYSKSRVKVSPYRRSGRVADLTNTSLQANYTGNNTTMEMDISESSSFLEHSSAPLDDSSYLRGLRSIRGRSSYKPLKEITLRHLTANKSIRSTASANISSPVSDAHSRPTGTVVGRKRKPDTDDVIELGVEVTEPLPAPKRMRVLDRIAEPFRRAAASLPSVARRNAEIVGINTDLPLTAPVVSTSTFDPESLKCATSVPATDTPATNEPVAVPLAPLTHEERDSKRCSIM